MRFLIVVLVCLFFSNNSFALKSGKENKRHKKKTERVLHKSKKMMKHKKKSKGNILKAKNLSEEKSVEKKAEEKVEEKKETVKQLETTGSSDSNSEEEFKIED